MKKLLLTVAVLLPSLLALSQEADDLGSKSAEVLLVARAEYASSEEDHLGNSSFYAVLDGSFNSKLSYSVEAHLLSSDPAYLYTNMWRSDSGCWLDWANLTYDFGGVSLTAGKIAQFVATWENDGYDFDQYYEMASWLWNNWNVYQWGLQLDWSPSENHTLGVSWLTSPYGERPFGSKLFTYSIYWKPSPCDWFNGLTTVNFFQTGDGGWLPMWNTGLKFMAGEKWDFVWDSVTMYDDGVRGQDYCYVNWRPTDFWEIQARGGYINKLNEGDSSWMTGLSVAINPLKSLRIHSLVAYHSLLNSALFNIGLTWKLTL